MLDTTFETDTGAVTLTDCMPIRTGQPDVVRLVRGVRGTVRMRTELVIRFDYGSVTPWVRRTESGLSAVGGPDTIEVHTPVPLRGEGWTTVGEFEVAEGDQVPFVLTWHQSHEDAPRPVDAALAIEATVNWWHLSGSHRQRRLQPVSARCVRRGPRLSAS